MTDLLPCPFCGSGNHAIFPPSCKKTDPYDPADRAYPIVRCSHCFTEVPGDDWDNSTRSAIERWNRRATAAEATVTALQEALEPFASAAAAFDPPENDDDFVTWGTKFTIGDLRRARTALSQIRSEK